MSGHEVRSGVTHARAAAAILGVQISSRTSRRPAFITSATSRRTIALFRSLTDAYLSGRTWGRGWAQVCPAARSAVDLA
jgi:hypothetical protein